MTQKDTPELDLARIAADERIVERGCWRKLRHTAGLITFTREAVAAYYCARDPSTSLSVKATILATLAYFVVPMDLIPDVILALGYTDDITVFWAAWRIVSRHITDAHRRRAAELLGQKSKH